MLIFLGPDRPEPPVTAPGDVVVHGVEGLFEAAYSKRPEHLTLKAQVAAVNLQAQALATALGEALPDELQDFWRGYAGWFANYSVAPLLANWLVAREALEAVSASPVAILEHWRSGPWWSGRYQVEPALRDELRARGRSVRHDPGALLRLLQPPLMRLALRRQRAADLRAELAVAAEGRDLPPPEPGSVLWLSVGASSAALMAHLIPALQREHGLPSEILEFNYFGSAAACRGQGLPYRNVMSLVPDGTAVVRAAWRQAPGWVRHFQARADGLSCREGLPPALWAALRERMELVLARDAGLWLLRAEAARRALDVYQPRAVVGFHVYGPPIVPLIVEAEDRGLPRLCLQHGVIGPRYLTLPCQRFSEKLVFGTYAREIMTQVCPPGMPVTVTGHCLYDAALGSAPPTPGPQVQRLREGARGLVVLCTQFNEHLYYRPEGWWLAEVARVCRELGARLAIKVHPSDPPQHLAWYRSLERPGDDLVQVIPHGQHPLGELLAACDVMVTRDSTVVFEANALDKPAVTINLGDIEEELPYAATGGALAVYRFEDIAPRLQQALHDPATRAALAASRPAFLEAHTGPADGQATARITACLAAWATGKRLPVPSGTQEPS